MRREVRLLRAKAFESLLLSIEFFNRPDDRGRTTSVLIFLDHSFEMLLKASIVHRGGAIREKRTRETIGFDTCVRRALSDGSIKFLTEEQALTLQAINGLRDAAHHYLIDPSEEQLYMHAQSGVTLFRDILGAVFGQNLAGYLPSRVLPVSTVAPTDMATLFDKETAEIRKLLGPGKRRRTEAYARLRPLAVLDGTIEGQKLQPSNRELTKKARQISEGKTWADVFPGAASVDYAIDGEGPAINLRLTKKSGLPVQMVPEGTPGASVVGVRRVNELDFYSLSATELAEHVGLTMPKTNAVIQHLDLCEDVDFFKEIRMGKSKFKRYSPKAIAAIQEALKVTPIDEIWEKHKAEAH